MNGLDWIPLQDDEWIRPPQSLWSEWIMFRYCDCHPGLKDSRLCINFELCRIFFIRVSHRAVTFYTCTYLFPLSPMVSDSSYYILRVPIVFAGRVRFSCAMILFIHIIQFSQRLFYSEILYMIWNKPTWSYGVRAVAPYPSIIPELVTAP